MSETVKILGSDAATVAPVSATTPVGTEAGVFVRVVSQTNAAQETGGNLAAILALDQLQVVEQLKQIAMELRVTNHLLREGLNVRDDLDALRADDYFRDPLKINN